MSRHIISKMLCVALASTVITTVDVPSAEAQRKTLLEQWFPKAAQRLRAKRNRELQLQRPPAAPIKKVSGPSYYTYKTESLKTVSLAGLLPLMDPEVVLEEIATAKPVREPVGPELLGEDDWRSGDHDSVGVDLSSTGSTGVVSRKRTRIIPAHALTNGVVEGVDLKLEAGIAAAIQKHYTSDPSFLWIDRDFKMTESARQVISVLENAGEVGLDPADYAVDAIEIGLNDIAGPDDTATEKRAARFELALSAAILRYGADAQSGRINPNRISGYHDFPKYNRDYDGVMAAVSASETPASTLAGLNPDNERFAMLMAELAELRASVDEDDIEPIAPGTFFKPGQSHGEVPKVVALIERKASDELKVAHQATLAAYDGSELFSEELVALVRDFQKESGLGPDGIVGKNTIAKLQTASPRAKIAKIELAMERLRWHPHALGSRHVFINQPAYNASYMVDGKARLSMRAIVGKPTNQTYFFNDTIEVVEVNPYWNVPRSILINQKLGKIRANPGYLSANGYEVITARGVTDPYSVDWYSGSLNGVQIRQRPGSSNALGELKILFPNKHAIYMHDTPARNLFQRSSRAYSSGCIRLHKPREMAAAVLGSSVGYVGNQIASGQNRTLPVKNKIPVYVSYFTAWPGDSGRIGYYADIYGRDKALTRALKRVSDLRANTSLTPS